MNGFLGNEERFELRKAIKRIGRPPTDEEMVAWKRGRGIVSNDTMNKPKFRETWLKQAREQHKVALLVAVQ